MGTINSIICAIISALFTVFLAHMSRRKTRVTIYCMENTLLTQRPNVPGLAVFVKYEDMMPIENLWRICYMLKNTGNQNIVGEGTQSSLVTKGYGLPLYTRNIKQIIQISATDNSIAELKDNTLYFKQWLPDECITIEALVESAGEKPELYIDKRDIINAKVIVKNNINK